jgi:RNA polymerase sigma factor (sigma-70 family)
VASPPRRHRAVGDPQVRDRLVLTCAPMVDHIARLWLRDRPPHCEHDDVASCGLEALTRGIDCYDEASAATLEQFLWTRVRATIENELRRPDAAPASNLVPWDATSRLAAGGSGDPALASALDEAKHRFRDAFRALPDRDRRVAIVVHVDDLRQDEIGEMLGVTGSRVCQITAALGRDLRLRVAGDAPLLAAAF